MDKTPVIQVQSDMDIIDTNNSVLLKLFRENFFVMTKEKLIVDIIVGKENKPICLNRFKSHRFSFSFEIYKETSTDPEKDCHTLVDGLLNMAKTMKDIDSNLCFDTFCYDIQGTDCKRDDGSCFVKVEVINQFMNIKGSHNSDKEDDILELKTLYMEDLLKCINDTNIVEEKNVIMNKKLDILKRYPTLYRSLAIDIINITLDNLKSRKEQENNSIDDDNNTKASS